MNFELLKCPICLEIPGDDIFQCRSGHMLCGECIITVDTCPQCRIPLYEEDRIRNLMLESVMDTMQFPCYNKDAGCKKKFPRKDLRHHSDVTCEYNKTNSMQLCHAIGYEQCEFRWNTNQLDHLLKHFETEHDVIVKEGQALEVLLHNFADTTTLGVSGVSLWTPIVLKPSFQDIKPTCLILGFVNADEQTMSWSCVQLCNYPPNVLNPPKIYSEFTFKSKFYDSEIGDITWRTQAFSLKEADVFLNAPVNSYPLPLLKEYYMKDNALVLNITLSLAEPDVPQKRGMVTIQSVELRKASQSQKVSEPDYAEGQCDQCEFNVTCSNCQKSPIRGALYHCLRCSIVYELCNSCMKARAHAHHIFAKIHDDGERETIVKFIAQIKKLRQDMAATSNCEKEESSKANDEVNQLPAFKPMSSKNIPETAPDTMSAPKPEPSSGYKSTMSSSKIISIPSETKFGDTSSETENSGSKIHPVLSTIQEFKPELAPPIPKTAPPTNTETIPPTFELTSPVTTSDSSSVEATKNDSISVKIASLMKNFEPTEPKSKGIPTFMIKFPPTRPKVEPIFSAVDLNKTKSSSASSLSELMGTECTTCKAPIGESPLHKCIQCIDYYQCDNCMEANSHPEHLFLYIQSQDIHEKLKGDGITPILNQDTMSGLKKRVERIPLHKARQHLYFANVVCNSCNAPVLGTQFRCLRCRGIELCSACVGKADSHEHKVFAVARNSKERMLLVLWIEVCEPANLLM